MSVVDYIVAFKPSRLSDTQTMVLFCEMGSTHSPKAGLNNDSEMTNGWINEWRGWINEWIEENGGMMRSRKEEWKWEEGETTGCWRKGGENRRMDQFMENEWMD